ncbi:MAG: DUF4919 domain-containing protein [Planctomycetales bacterium]|nr:DUF4919 domain-containing protein [Planctomycetales bacterium]
MQSALRAFVAQPSREHYLAARAELLAASSRSLHAAELDSLSLLADAGDVQGLTESLAQLPPIAALVPRVHYYAALAAEALGDEQDLELERMLLVICLRAILMTGDGSEESPYVVSAASDELDLLDELDLIAASNSLVHRGDSAFDVVRCEDGTDIWFDASAMVQIPAEMPAVSPVRKPRTVKPARTKPRRRLSRTGR